MVTALFLASVPPTSEAVDVPGMSTARFENDLDPVGTASMVSRRRTVCWMTFCTSTVGAAPDTVMVSSTAPTRSSALTVAVNEAGRSIPSRLTTLNPLRVNVTV